MNQLNKLIKKLCPNGAEYKTIQELCEITRGKVISKDFIRYNIGEYPVYSSQTENNGELGKINTYDFNGEYLTWTTDGANAGSVFYRNGKFSITNVCGLLKTLNNKITTKFLFYILSIEAPKYVNTGMGNPKLMSNVMAKIRVAVPPLEVQDEIVRILDDFTLLSAKLSAKLSAELKARQKQYEYYKDELYSFKNKNVKYVKLKDISQIIRGGNFQKKDFMDEGKPCIHYGQIYTRYGSNVSSTFTYVSDEVFNKSKQAQPNDIIMAVTSENIEDVCKCVVWCGNENVAVSGHTAIIHHNINAKYLGYYFSTSHFYKDKTKLVHGTKVMEVTPSSLNEILIPLPNLNEQERIANLIENFDKLCNDITSGIPAEIKARKKQYEYYRDKILTFRDSKND